AEYGPVNVELPYSLTTQLCNSDETPNPDGNPRVNDQTEESVSASNPRYQPILSIRGAIDRLDLSEAGGLVVVDYKTGSNRPYQRLKAEDPNPEGGHLQLVLYTLAARQLILQAKVASEQQTTTTSGGGFTSFSTSDGNTRLSAISKRISFKESLNTKEDQGEYWFVSSKGGFTSKGYSVHSVEAQVLKTTAAIVGCISSGIFPKRGAAKDGKFGAVCRFCSPDGLSMRAVNLAWKRKLEDPVISRYLEIVTQ
ncbi:MAG: PD-(D/E)XK nuclease family protein, partial [Acidimicrobiaceae bacterium]|nr:PD-(D/E)XK nuclease family protein [Acidimicrobiaceae bacterium]